MTVWMMTMKHTPSQSRSSSVKQPFNFLVYIFCQLFQVFPVQVFHVLEYGNGGIELQHVLRNFRNLIFSSSGF